MSQHGCQNKARTVGKSLNGMKVKMRIIMLEKFIKSTGILKVSLVPLLVRQLIVVSFMN